jgi:4-amino-4-deoxy-L-arabinose transferase-like glycosyltransferase
MNLAAFLVIHLAAGLLLALTAFVLGRLVLTRLDFSSTLEEIACSTTVGLGLLSLLLFAVGLLGGFSKPVLILLVLAIWIVGFPVWWRWRARAADVLRGLRRLPRRRILLWVLAVALVVVFTSPFWLLSFYPPRDWDDISYHLASAKEYAEQGRLVVTPYLRFAVFPQAVGMLFTLAFILADDITAQLVSALMWLLVGLLLFVWGRKDGSHTVGALAACLWLASPSVVRFSTTAYIDVGLTLFVLGGAYALFRWMEHRSPGWLLVAAFLVGMAAGSKYTGLFFLMFYAVAVFAVARPRERWRSILSFAAVAVVAASPWYLRSFLVTGDPLFPMLPEIFGYSFWNAEDIAIQRQELSSHGIGRGLVDFFTIWWHIGWNQGLFHSESLSSLALVVPLPILLLARWRNPRGRILCGLSIAFVMLWFQTAQVMRYLLPILPFLSLELAAVIDGIRRRVLPSSWKTARVVAAAAIAFYVLYRAVDYGAMWIGRWGPVPTSSIEREAFLSAELPDYPAYRVLNRKLGGDYTLYALSGSRMTYYADGVYRGDVFGPARESRIKSRLANGRALYQELQMMGADHFLISHHAGPVVLPDDEAFRQHFRLLYQNGEVRLYELVEHPE